MKTVERSAWAIGAFCSAASLLGALTNPGAFFPGYLLAYVFWIGLALGSMAVLMVHYQVGGAWGYVTRRILEAAMLTLPLMGILFLPLLFGVGVLFPWARPAAVAADPLLAHQEPYLNLRFFVLRAALYFACWLSCAGLLGRWSSRLDQGARPELLVRLKRLSGAGLVLYAFTMYFAGVDWVMSLEPHWSSTISGMITLASQGLSGFAVATAALVLLSTRSPLSSVATRPRLNDLGNLLLTTVMLWAYVSFSQYLIIWAENLPREITWYVRRTSPGWKAIALVLIVLHFGVPFTLLLFRKVKRNAVALGAIACGLLALRLVDDFWRIIPGFRPEGLGLHWTYITSLLGIGGLWLAWFVARLRRRPLLPLHDAEFAPVLQEAESHA